MASFMQNEASSGLVGEYEYNTLRLKALQPTSYYVVKRIFDILVAFVLLVILSPLMLVITLAILLYSPGPVFYTQERLGVRLRRQGRNSYWERITFPCFKFRTMKVNIDASIHRAYIQALIEDDHEKMKELQGGSTPILKLIQDPRITKPGKLLRKFSLDELPQLWNVIRGDMSLVGPRPAIPYEAEMYKHWHFQRLAAQPGITGLQQVVARSTVGFDQQVKLDLEYINNQSFWLDLKIILKTPLVVISTKGAE